MANKKKLPKKGVRYIASKLNKYFEKRYPTKKGALPKAKEVLSQLKSNGEKVTIKNISKLIRTPRGTTPKKGVAPTIYRELLEEKDYFGLVQYPEWIQATTNEVWFYSKIFPEGMPMIQGGSSVEYSDYFRPFVEYINKMIALEQGNDDLYQKEWQVVCKKPNNKNPRKRWESEIIVIGSDGIEYIFGFDPKNPDKAPTSVETTPDGRKGSKWDEEDKKAPQTTPKEPKSSKPSKPKKQPKGKTPKKITPKAPKGKPKPDSDAKSKVELKRLTIIDKIMDMFLQGKITKEEMNTMIAKYE
jgi:hypothetical protein